MKIFAIVCLIFALIAALFGAIYTLAMCFVQHNAETLLVKSLVGDKAFINIYNDIRKKNDSCGPVDEVVIEKIIYEGHIENLSLTHQKCIEAGLLQRSMRGRANYINKILRMVEKTLDSNTDSK